MYRADLGGHAGSAVPGAEEGSRPAPGSGGHRRGTGSRRSAPSTRSGGRCSRCWHVPVGPDSASFVGRTRASRSTPGQRRGSLGAGDGWRRRGVSVLWRSRSSDLAARHIQKVALNIVLQRFLTVAAHLYGARHVDWLDVAEPGLSDPPTPRAAGGRGALRDRSVPRPRRADAPRTFALGHEAVVEVVTVGDDVAAVAVGGARTLPSFQVSCGRAHNLPPGPRLRSAPSTRSCRTMGWSLCRGSSTAACSRTSFGSHTPTTC